MGQPVYTKFSDMPLYSGDTSDIDFPAVVSGVNYRTKGRNITSGTFLTLADLRLEASPIANKIYNVTDAGREGPWIYDPSDVTSTDNGGTIVLSGTKRFKKLFTGPINVKYFGAVADYNTTTNTGTDNAAAFAAATTAAVAAGLPLYIPSGKYGLSSYTIKQCSILGDGSQTTFIYALPSAGAALFTLGAGAILSVMHYGFTMIGRAANTGQHGYYLKALEQSIPSYTGGFWYSLLRDIQIKAFPGHGIHLEALDDGAHGGDLANQFLTFHNVRSYRAELSTSRSLYVYGQCGQTVFDNCQFDGADKNLAGSINIEIATGTYNSISISTTHLQFKTCTIQNSERGVSMSTVRNVTFEGCWFENLKYATDWLLTSTGTMNRNRFANVLDGAGGGYYALNSSSNLNFTYNEYSGNIENTVKCSNHFGLRMYGNYYTGASVASSPSIGAVRQKALPSTGNLSVQNNNDLFINADVFPLGSLTGQLSPGEQFRLHMFENSVVNSYILITNTGNITLPQWANGQVILRKNDIATFTLRDIGGTWILESVSQGNNRTGTAIPTTGGWFAGEKIYRASPTTGQSIGWTCTTSGWFAPTAWVTSTVYTLNSIVSNAGKAYIAVNGGTSGATAPTHSSSTTDVSDGAVTWHYLGAVITSSAWVEFGLVCQNKFGVSTKSGNGSLTSFTIPHGITGTPSFIFVGAGSSDAKNISYYTADATNITVNYDVAPPTGTNNLKLNWEARL
jgi:hypothetical protein